VQQKDEKGETGKSPSKTSAIVVRLYIPGPNPEQISQILYPFPARLERKQYDPPDSYTSKLT